MVNIGSSEIVLFLLIIISFAIAYYYLIDFNLQNKALTINFTKGVKNIVKAVNGSNSAVNSTVMNPSGNITIIKTTVFQTTTSTIRIMFLNTPGVMANVIKTNEGSMLINCGNNISIADKIFINGGMPLNGMLITTMDYDHMGACGNTAMLIPPSVAFDTGMDGSDEFFSRYYLSVGNKRSPLGQGLKFGFNNITGTVIRSINGANTIEYDFGKTKYVYADGCDSECIRTLLPNKTINILVLSQGNLNSSVMISMLPSLVAMNNASQDILDVAHKYGIKIIDVGKSGDFEISINGNKENWNVLPIK